MNYYKIDFNKIDKLNYNLLNVRDCIYQLKSHLFYIPASLFNALMSAVIFSELTSVRVKASNLLSKPLASLPEPVLDAWISLNSANQGCCKVSSRDGLFCLFFSRSSIRIKNYKKLLTFDNIFCFGRNCIPWLETEIWSILDGLSGNFLVFLVIEWQDSTEEEI